MSRADRSQMRAAVACAAMHGLLDALRPPGGGLELHVLRGRADVAAVRACAAERVAYEETLSAALHGSERWGMVGFCQACERAVVLQGDWNHSDGRTPNYRERLECPHCHLNNRQRFVAYVVRSALREQPAEGAVYLYEQITPFYAWAARELPATVIGSEYLGHDVPGGAVIDGIRHEDALALSFAEGSLEMIVSQDVFEHVPDIDRSLTECARVLRDGGRMLFSVPFTEALDETVQRSELRDGELVELLPAQYHGNPLSSQGSLVFYDYGWDLLARCERAGFTGVQMLGYWSAQYGYVGGGGLQWIFLAERAPR